MSPNLALSFPTGWLEKVVEVRGEQQGSYSLLEQLSTQAAVHAQQCILCPWLASRIIHGTQILKWVPSPCPLPCEIGRSYQCPPYSCWILVIPVDSGGIPAEFTSQNFTPAMKLCNSSIYTGMVPGVWSLEWHWNPVTGIEIKNSKYGNFCIFT